MKAFDATFKLANKMLSAMIPSFFKVLCVTFFFFDKNILVNRNKDKSVIYYDIIFLRQRTFQLLSHSLDFLRQKTIVVAALSPSKSIQFLGFCRDLQKPKKTAGNMPLQNDHRFFSLLSWHLFAEKRSLKSLLFPKFHGFA